MNWILLIYADGVMTKIPVETGELCRSAMEEIAPFMAACIQVMG